jgi:hypothetical protein
VTSLAIADASPAEIAAIRERLARIGERARGEAPSGPFLVATPLGLSRREALEQALAAAGIAIATRAAIAFPAVATALYVRSAADEEELHRAAAFERLWEAWWAAPRAERWTLASADAFTLLLGSKRAIRAAVPSREARVTTPRRTWIVRLHAFHAPDEGRLDLEARIVSALVGGP